MKKYKHLPYLVICMIITFSIILTFSIFSENKSSALNINDEFILSGGFDIIPDNNNNFFILSYDNDHTESLITYYDSTASDENKICHLTNPVKNAKSTLDYKYDSAVFINNALYISKIDNLKGTLNIEKYIISGKSLTPIDTFTVSINSNFNNQSFAVANCNGTDRVFLISNNLSSIEIYSFSNGMKSNDTLSKDNLPFSSLKVDPSSMYLYALTTYNKIVRFDLSKLFDSDSEILDINDLSSSFEFLSDNVFIDTLGNVYILNQSDFTIDSSFNVVEDEFYNCACMLGEDKSTLLNKNSNTIINCFNLYNSNLVGNITLSDKILKLSTSGTTTIAITEANNKKYIQTLDTSDIEEISPPSSDPDDSSSDDSSSDPSSSDSSDDNPNPPGAITSDTYYINYNNNTISKIPVETTILEFKENINYEGYTPVFTNSFGRNQSSGYICTGSKVLFLLNNKVCYKFTFIVTGDITGNGLCDSRDLNALYDHLLNKKPLSGVYLEAADLNGDNEVNTTDLLLLKKQLYT